MSNSENSETTISAVSAQWRKSRKTACSDNSGTPYRSCCTSFDVSGQENILKPTSGLLDPIKSYKQKRA